MHYIVVVMSSLRSDVLLLDGETPYMVHVFNSFHGEDPQHRAVDYAEWSNKQHKQNLVEGVECSQ